MMKLLKYLYNDHHTTQSTINKVLVFQGDDMLHEIYYNIGVVEVQTLQSVKSDFIFVCYNTLQVISFFCPNVCEVHTFIISDK